MKQFILAVSLLLSVIIIFTSCSKTGEYKLRPAKSSEIGTQAICPVTSNVFNVTKETKAVDFKGKIKVVKLNTDEASDIAAKYGIMGIPTLMFFVGGKDVDRVVGYMTKEALAKKIESVIANK